MEAGVRLASASGAAAFSPCGRYRWWLERRFVPAGAEPGGRILFIGLNPSAAAADHDAPGLNHLAFAAASMRDVDALHGWLKQAGIAALYDTPKHRPEFASNDGDTYYQVMFASPDGILFEMVYIGPMK